MKNLTLTVQDNIATVVFDLEKEKVNKLSFAVLEELDTLLDQIKNNDAIDVVVFESNKPSIFIAGADINEIKSFDDEAIAYKTLVKADDVLTKIETLPMPTIAYVNGACMGGGLEFVLCCNYIAASTNDKTKFAFPEVKLGFFPGLGGTQRMPKRVGLIHALDMILTGKTIDAKKAQRMGLTNIVFDHGQKTFKLNAFIQDVLDKKIKKPRLSFMHKFMQSNPLTQDIIYKKTLENIQKKVNPDFKAPYLALEVIQRTFGKSFDEGILIEAKTFAKLAITKESKNLIDLFFMFEKAKKSFEKTDNPIQSTAVLGNGIMGRGIIWLFSKYAKEVRVKVRKIEQIQSMIKEIAKGYDFFIKSRKMSKNQVAFKLSKISYTQDFSGFAQTQLALEAIIEDKKAKRETFEQLEAVLPKDAIIATNTSSISIEKLAKKVKNKKNFLGVHFFNPVNKMPLVEVIPTKETSKKTINRVFELLISCGKTPILVGDCAGFVVNRVLLPYINEAGFILEEGSNIKEIDGILKDFGLPMGPFTLADTVGIDIGFHVASILNKSYGERMPIAPLLQNVYENKLLGVKTKKGFYEYVSKEKVVNQEIYQWQKDKKKFNQEEIISRCIYIMINEASRILEEHIVSDAQTVDLAMIAGTGFPPYKGGLLKYADEIGIAEIVTELRRLQERYGQRFEPSKLLQSLQKQNLTFYTGETLWNH
jgi:3-hydroxyacyl-CoA dehydrogenase/enoyl-CoA hydratase/3-hydroxybutyryl-CoA epimerase